MIFAISMDYTVFLLSSAKEHWDRSHDPREAMVGGVAHSGRVVFAAAAVMVAVFFTFALSGPLPPKEMGVILGIAVLLDAAARPAAAGAGRAAAARHVGVVAAQAARPRPARRPLRHTADADATDRRTRMIFRQLTHDDLGCASYLVGDEDAGVAAVVDPKLDIDEYLRLARYLGVRIEHILETHNHADHVSGHGRLAAATGATIHIHRDADARLRARAVRRRLGAASSAPSRCARCTRPATGPSTPRSR